MNLRSATLALHRLQKEKYAAPIDHNLDFEDSGKLGVLDNVATQIKQQTEKQGAEDCEEQELLSGEEVLATFMRLAGEPITWVETAELWRDMRSTNIGKLPKFHETLNTSHHHALDVSYRARRNIDLASPSDTNHSGRGGKDGKLNKVLETAQDVSELSDDELVVYSSELAREIKKVYSIRLHSDKSEFRFVLGSLTLLWVTVIAVVVAGYFYPENLKIGTFSSTIFVEAFSLFGIELVWECMLSWVVLRYNIKINYTRKIGNLIKVPKYFMADIFGYPSSALSLTMALAINQTLFAAMFYRRSRERFSACAYVFLSQDRREDRPDTLIFQLTEDIMRFAIYFPFKLLVVDFVGEPGIIFIPIAVNNIGDGLAEPVGVKWGKHKYSTTALYHKGQFFKSKFTRSYEGSACVLVTTFVVVAANYNAFNSTQFWITFAVLPFLMTIAEAKAPHTNDGPFLAIVGCGFLSLMFLLL